MHYDFDLKIDRVASFSKEDFNKAEKDWLLNEALLILVKQLYSGLTQTRTSFEHNQKRIDDLSSLHVKYPLQPSIPLVLLDGVYELDLEDLAYDYLFLTRGWVDVRKPGCTVKVKMREIQNDDLNDLLNDPFNSPNEEGIPINFGRSTSGSGSSIYLYPGSLELISGYVEYIKVPTHISVGGYTYIDGTPRTTSNTDLPTHLHGRLVDLAVDIASGIIENPEYVQLKAKKLFNYD